MALTPRISKSTVSALSLAAALSIAAAPAQAADIPAQATAGSPLALTGAFDRSSFDTTTYDGNADIREWRRWGRRGWRRGWHGRRHRGIGAGEVIAGVAILGGIAAIASANNNRRRDRDVVIVERERYRADVRDDYRYDEQRDIQRDQEIQELRRRTDEQQREIEYLRSRGLDASRVSGAEARQNALPPVSQLPPVTAPLTIDGAIDRCTQVVELDAQVSGIDGVDRTQSGWSVRGRIADGQSFSCEVGNDGQIQRLSNGAFSSLGGTRDTRDVRYYETQRAAGQWSDDRYADARGAMSGQRFADARYASQRGAYPSGTTERVG
ncbi:MAG: hypothetical protein AAFR88_08975, partial [Pseudomonadota bacterium]